MTSHAALVARQMGKLCGCCETLGIDYARREMRVADRRLGEGDWFDRRTTARFFSAKSRRILRVMQVLLHKSSI